MELTEYIVTRLDESEAKSLEIEGLARHYLAEHLQLEEESFDYSNTLVTKESEIKRIVGKINARYQEDGLAEPFNLKGSSENLLSKGSTFHNLRRSLEDLIEPPHSFADRVGREILHRLGCAEDKINITPDSGDKGIDYWGEWNLSDAPAGLSHNVLIIGQVKKASLITPVSDLREFVGAVRYALATKYFGENYNEYSPSILHFVTTGELSVEGASIAKVFNIKVFKRRHLIEMNLIP